MDQKNGFYFLILLLVFTFVGINHSATQTPDSIPLPMIDSLLQGLYPLADTSIAQDSIPEKKDSTATQTGRKSFPKILKSAPVDSSKISYFYAMNPDQIFPYPDTTLHGIEIFDPARQADIPYATLGNLGAAHYQKVYQPTFQTGFDPGYHQYDLYKIDPEKIRYFKLHKMFTNFYYTQGRKQTDGYFKGIFSRNFTDGFRLNFEMKRISQTGDYAEELKSNTAISTGVWYQSKNKRYDAFWSMTNNAIKSYDSGGIQTDTLFGQRYYGNTLNIPVILEGARTVQVSQDYAWLQHYTLGGQTDSTGQTKRNFRLSHRLRYNPNLYKSFDVPPTTGFSEKEDSLYHNFNVHPQGLRNYTKVKTLENSFFISTGKSGKNKATQKDKLEIGLRHFYHNIYLEPQDTNVNNLLLTGRLNFEPIPAIALRTYAQLGLWGGAGEYRAQAELELSPGNLGNLQVQFLSQRKSPELPQQKLYISEELMWDNDFKKIFETSLSAKYTLEQFRLEIIGGYHLIDNYIYFVPNAQPRQNAGVINIFQLSLKKDFTLGILNFNNKITIQQDNSSAIELPDFVSDHSLYIQTHVFRKAMLLQAGLNLHLTDNYQPYAYMPLIGQFHLQQARTGRPYFWFAETDFFLNFQISSFRGFVKVANISDFFYSEKYYPTYNHPMFDWRIRWGFSWRFLD